MSLLSSKRSVMTLFSEPADPIGHSVRIVLAEKDVNVDVKYVSLEDRPEDLADLNPYNQVLTLVDRDLVLYDAQIMMEYLDERFPHPPLMPVDPVARSHNRQIRLRVMRDLYGMADDLNRSNQIASTSARKIVRDNLTAIAVAFNQHEYFMSDEYSLVDCCMAPFLWRLGFFGIQLPAQAKPLMKYADRLFSRHSFKASLSEVEKEMHSS